MKGIALFIVWIFVVIIGGCAAINFPSVCDQMDRPSLLCDTAQKYGIRLEDIGKTLIVANAVAIGEGKYTREQAIKVLEDIRIMLNSPVSYLVLRLDIYNKVSKYPGLFEVADIYFGEFSNMAMDVYPADVKILKDWLDSRIAALI